MYCDHRRVVAPELGRTWLVVMTGAESVEWYQIVAIP